MKSTAMAIAVLLAAVLKSPAAGQDIGAAAVPSPAEVLSRFAEGWDETLWQQKVRGQDGYMRPVDDLGWQLRMRTLQKLVHHGEASIPVLVEALNAESVPERILAAQALGYLGPGVPVEPLLKAATSDSSAAVRLYAVDSLGMRGIDDGRIDWKALREKESNRDVRKHIDYALERKGQPLDPAIIKRLIEWNAETMNSATLGKPAPDFALTAATGKTIRLSDFRGKKSVVLVFIYGDT